MASVYEVTHTVLATRHALKVLHNATSRVRDRLIREGKMQAHLDPRHVVPVTDVLDVNGSPALLMPYVAGCSLSDLLNEHRPSPAECAALFRPIVVGVGHAHAAGIVHRDIKPANVLLEIQHGKVAIRVADFGLGRGIEADALQTSEGLFLGTPAYASPEQFIDASSVDTRADLWSLGALLYELVVGHPPFAGATGPEVRRAVLAGEVDLGKVPEPWSSLVAGLLTEDVDQRIATAGLILKALDDGLGTGPLLAEGAIGQVITRLVTQAEAGQEPWFDASGNAGGNTGATLAPSVFNPHATSPTIDLDLQAPTLSPHQSIAHNLPSHRTPFIGRSADLAALASAVDHATVVSVVGTGGVGKTRLALEYAWTSLQRWTGGVAFCDLVDARGLESVLGAIARALDVPLPKGDISERLSHAIAGRGHCLIILDNVEQVADVTAELLADWLKRTNNAHFVLTTRVRIGLASEHELPLEPMVPIDSAALFIARARVAKPAFSPLKAEKIAIEELVALLDHLPLAIELAAARVRVAGPRKLLTRMSSRFRVLASSSGRDKRQATLRATLDWSWELMTPAEQGAFAQMAVFERGFDLEAAEAIIDVQHVDDGAWTLDLVQALVDQSMLRAQDNERFSMLVSVHEYAQIKLDESNERAVTEQRHGEWYAQLGTPESLNAMVGHHGAQSRQHLLDEVDNLLVANRRAVDHSNNQIAANTALAAWVSVTLTVPLAVGLRVFKRTLALPNLTTEQRARLLERAGFAAWSNGDNEEAATHFEQGLQAARAVNSPHLTATILTHQAFVCEHSGQTDDAKHLFEQAIATAPDDGHPIARGRALHGLGNLEQLCGDLDNAQLHLDQALEIHTTFGDERSAAKALGFLGNLSFQRGQLDAAEDHYRSAHTIYTGMRDRRSASWALGNVGVVHAERGDVELACDTFEEALQVHQEVGDRRTAGVVMNNLAEMYRLLGRRARARSLFQQSLAVNREVGSLQFEGIVLGNLGSMLREDGQLDTALDLLNQAIRCMQAAGDVWSEADTWVEWPA